MRILNRLPSVLLVLVFAGAAVVAAQGKPQTREGFWIGFGIGGANGSGDCDGCDLESTTGGSGYLKLGGRLGAQWLLGGEINTWIGSPNDKSIDVPIDVTVGYVTASAYFYPTVTSGFFLKGGVGYYTLNGTYQQGGPDVSSSAPALMLGAGYDIRVGKMISIVPTLTYAMSGNSDIDVEGFGSASGFHTNIIALQVGVTFH